MENKHLTHSCPLTGFFFLSLSLSPKAATTNTNGPGTWPDTCDHHSLTLSVDRSHFHRLVRRNANANNKLGSQQVSHQARRAPSEGLPILCMFFFLARCFGFALSYPVSRPPRRQGWGLKVAPITPQMAPLPTGMPAAVAANSSAAAATRSTNTNVDCTPARLKTSIAIDANVLF